MEEMAGALRLPTLRVLCVVFCRAGKQSAPAAEQKTTPVQLTVGRGKRSAPAARTEDNASAANRREGKPHAPAAEQKTMPMQLTVGRVSAAHPP